MSTQTFRKAKCKELLAFLIDRQGSTVTRAEAFAALWEDRTYDRPMQKQFDTVIRLLRESLKEHGIEEIFSMKSRIASTETAADRILFLAIFRVHRLLTAKKVPDIQVGMIPTIWKILPYRSL